MWQILAKNATKTHHSISKIEFFLFPLHIILTKRDWLSKHQCHLNEVHSLCVVREPKYFLWSWFKGGMTAPQSILGKVERQKKAGMMQKEPKIIEDTSQSPVLSNHSEHTRLHRFTKEDTFHYQMHRTLLYQCIAL